MSWNVCRHHPNASGSPVHQHNWTIKQPLFCPKVLKFETPTVHLSSVIHFRVCPTQQEKTAEWSARVYVYVRVRACSGRGEGAGLFPEAAEPSLPDIWAWVKRGAKHRMDQSQQLTDLLLAVKKRLDSHLPHSQALGSLFSAEVKSLFSMYLGTQQWQQRFFHPEVTEIRILLRCIRSKLPPLRGHKGRYRMSPAFVVVLLAAVSSLFTLCVRVEGKIQPTSSRCVSAHPLKRIWGSKRTF